MFKFNNMTIKQKVVLGITLAVLASTIILGVMAQRQARDVLEHRLVDIELPSMLEQISAQIDREVSSFFRPRNRSPITNSLSKPLPTRTSILRQRRCWLNN